MSLIKVDVEIKDEAEEIEMLQMAEAKLMKVYELLGIDPLQMDGADLEENALEAAQLREQQRGFKKDGPSVETEPTHHRYIDFTNRPLSRTGSTRRRAARQ